MQSESCHHLTCSTETVKLTCERLGRLRTDHHTALETARDRKTRPRVTYAILIALKERERQRESERLMLKGAEKSPDETIGGYERHNEKDKKRLRALHGSKNDLAFLRRSSLLSFMLDSQNGGGCHTKA